MRVFATPNWGNVIAPPLYPFGFGLSYTTFSYSEPVAKTSAGGRFPITVQVTLTNTGKIAGEEVAQLYTRDLVGSVTRPVRELKGFQKIMLQPGESKMLTFTLQDKDLAFYRRNMTFGTEPGEYDVMVGGNSTDVKSVRVRLNK